MYLPPPFPPLRLSTLARALIAQSAKWTHHLSAQELRTLYNILTTMLHDVHPNDGNMLIIGSLLGKVPDGKDWHDRVLRACEAHRGE